MSKSPASNLPGRNASKPIVFCDFDGTVTLADVTDCILEELADPSWRELEAAWVGGQIGSRECLQRQLALVQTSPKQLNSLIDGIALDPSFAAFYRFTERIGMPFYVLSDGFDYVIRRVLRRAGVDGELRNGKHLFTSAMELEGNRVRVSFPHGPKVCEHGCATCKAAIIQRVGRGHQPVIFIGDGLSDQYAVEHSDLVFAKKQLLAHCQKNKIPCLPFETFAEIEAALEEMFATVPGGSKGTAHKQERTKAPGLGAHARISIAD
jgi:2-hydroxy-3-keto-5-methylthiopentenyl-1-phosphate phosphatase